MQYNKGKTEICQCDLFWGGLGELMGVGLDAWKDGAFRRFGGREIVAEMGFEVGRGGEFLGEDEGILGRKMVF